MAEAWDEELAAGLRAGLSGDQRAYAAFLQAIAGRLRRTLRARTDAAEAEDIVQETLLALHLKRHTWDGRAVLPWVHAIARHKLIDAFRRRGRRIELDISDFIDQIPQPEEDRVSDRDIDRALGLLAPGQKAVVAAISVQGRTIAETAQGLGLSEGAVRVALHRGLAAISRHFSEG